jgi:hypothetical protein
MSQHLVQYEIQSWHTNISSIQQNSLAANKTEHYVSDEGDEINYIVILHGCIMCEGYAFL